MIIIFSLVFPCKEAPPACSTAANTNTIQATANNAGAGGTKPAKMNNANNEITKLEQQLQDIREQVGVRGQVLTKNLRRYYTCNQNVACFVFYLKAINTFKKNEIKYASQRKLSKELKIALKFK